MTRARRTRETGRGGIATVLLVASLVPATSCAHDAGRGESVVPVAVPAADSVTRIAPPPHDVPLTLAVRDDGWPISELIDIVASATDSTIDLHPSVPPATRERRVELVGTLAIPRDRALEWLQAVLSYYRLVMVPTGPPDACRHTVIEQRR